MDNTLEKLIELFRECFDTGCYSFDEIAENLIRNGVGFVERDCHWATEQAYKNGYEKGYADGERKCNERTR